MKLHINADVLIIGAGVSGLAAAAALAGYGLNTAIVEARGRAGGRVLTLRDPVTDWPVELGAEFVHGEAPELLDLLSQSYLRTCNADVDHWFLKNGQLTTGGAFFENVEPIFSLMEKRAAAGDQSFSEFAEDLRRQGRDEQSLEMARRYVEGFNAADAADVSIAWLVRQDQAAEKIGGESQHRTVDGYDNLIASMHRRLTQLNVPIAFNSCVQEISWQKGNVAVTCQSQTGQQVHHARCLVVAVPIGVLKAGHGDGAIQFRPALSAKQAALDALVPGQAQRLILIFEPRFWNSLRVKVGDCQTSLNELGFLHAPDLTIPTWWTQNPMTTAMIVGWAAGPRYTALQSLKHAELRRLALQCLADAFSIDRQRLEENLLGFHTYDWRNDHLTRCAYSYVRKDGIEDAASLAEPIDNTLFFAGEHTDIDFAGTVHGAIRSGFRVARQVAGALEG